MTAGSGTWGQGRIGDHRAQENERGPDEEKKKRDDGDRPGEGRTGEPGHAGYSGRAGHHRECPPRFSSAPPRSRLGRASGLGTQAGARGARSVGGDVGSFPEPKLVAGRQVIEGRDQKTLHLRALAARGRWRFGRGRTSPRSIRPTCRSDPESSPLSQSLSPVLVRSSPASCRPWPPPEARVLVSPTISLVRTILKISSAVAEVGDGLTRQVGEELRGDRRLDQPDRPDHPDRIGRPKNTR